MPKSRSGPIQCHSKGNKWDPGGLMGGMILRLLDGSKMRFLPSPPLTSTLFLSGLTTAPKIPISSLDSKITFPRRSVTRPVPAPPLTSNGELSLSRFDSKASNSYSTAVIVIRGSNKPEVGGLEPRRSLACSCRCSVGESSSLTVSRLMKGPDFSWIRKKTATPDTKRIKAMID